MHLRRLPSRDGGQKHFLCSPKVVFFFPTGFEKKKKNSKEVKKTKKNGQKVEYKKKKDQKDSPTTILEKKKTR